MSQTGRSGYNVAVVVMISTMNGGSQAWTDKFYSIRRSMVQPAPGPGYLLSLSLLSGPSRGRGR